MQHDQSNLLSDEDYFKNQYQLIIGRNSHLWKLLWAWGILPKARLGMKERGTYPRMFSNWLQYLRAMAKSMVGFPEDGGIEGERKKCITGIQMAVEGTEKLLGYYTDMKKKKLWPKGHSDIAANKFVMEVKQIIQYKTGTHKGKTNWGDVKKLAKFYLHSDPLRFAYLKSISQQNETSLKSKINRFKGRKNQRPMSPPSIYYEESSRHTSE